MPIGPQNYPPGFTPDRNPGIVSRFIFGVGAVLAAVLGFANGVGASIISAFRQEAYDLHPDEPLSPELAADAIQRGVLPGADWHGEARLSGVSAERLDALVELSGNAPGPQELLFEWRKGHIDQARLEHGIRQGRIKNEWIDFYENQRFEPIPLASAITGVVQNHLDEARAEQVAGFYAIDPQDFAVMVANAGRPPGPEQMLHLRNRGFMTTAEVEQGIRESDIKDKYIPALLHLGEYLPPPRTVTTLLGHGAITPERAHQLFVANGLTDQDAAAYVASALHTKTATHKELAASTVKALYADHILTRAQAVDDLGRIGYLPPEANLVLDLADASANQKLRNQAIARVRTIFLSRKVDQATAEADLAKIGVDAGQVTALFALWNVERLTPTRTLTLGQLNQAVKKGILTPADFVARAEGLGYSADDAQILLDIDIPPQAP